MGNMRFIVDFMLGKLARKLRILGFDTIYVRVTNRDEILRKALAEKRVLLTRSHAFPKREDILIINSEYVKEQLKEVMSTFKLKPKPFTRCIICNTLLQSVKKEAVKGKVPFFVFQTHDDFVYCKKCNKFYWKGSHYKNMVEKLKGCSDYGQNT
ncbi:MAG TPA: hypothetical protein EYP60_05110 [bacterium (Candidatus Stahlbacteria)]|nr:hypothetical protein [Candidatus Stahlbacteria bacterium]